MSALGENAEPSLYGVSDGKAIGTYLEHKFRAYLTNKGYTCQMGNMSPNAFEREST